jgi:uncharacterized membrane protein (DUF2068 family)
VPTDAQARVLGRALSEKEPLQGVVRDAGIRLVITYKAVKAFAELLLAAGLMWLAGAGTQGPEHEIARFLRLHVASHWSVRASAALGDLMRGHGLYMLGAGLSLDGLLTALEGWSLWKGFRWGPWLVVLASLLPLPWELSGIGRAFSWPRVALATINVAVVGYLGWRITRGGQA